MEAIGTYQDYFWFLGGLCWLVAGLIWWRLDLDRTEWAWLPWSAAAGMLAASAQVCCWIFAGDSTPLSPPLLTVDVFLGGIAAIEIAGWWQIPRLQNARTWQRHVRLIIGALGLVVAALRDDWPRLGAVALVLSALGAALAGGSPNQKRPLSVRGALAATFAALLFSNWGPLAGTLFDSMRWADLASTSSFVIAVVQLCFAGAVLVSVLREPLRLHFERSGVQARREAAAFGASLLLWLGIGLAITYVASRSTRHEIETAALSRARTGALLVDKERLALCLGSDFKLNKIETFRSLQGGVMQRAISHWLAAERTAPLVATLTAIARTNPDTDDVFVATIKDGWLVGVIFTERQKPQPTVVSMERPAKSSDYEWWDSRTAHFSNLQKSAFGTSVQAWAPLLSAKGEMLGWLVMDWDPKGWIAAQSQSRLQTFAIVALGVFLCVLLFLHRLVHRQNEAVALEAGAAAKANRMKTTFLATVSHELRTPLQAIRGYGEMLETRHESVTTRPLFAALRSQVEVMHRLVGDLLDLSAMEAGGFRCERHPVEVGKLIADLVTHTQREAEDKGLGLRCEIAEDLPVVMLGDAVRLRQLCGNLLSNAVKYTDDGEVSIRVIVERREREFCDFAVIVDDTGPGIPEARRTALFQPFSRLDTTSVKEGSGLGLALASGLARNLGGELRLDQSGPEGSRFVVTLRWSISQSVPQPVSEAPLLPSNAKRINVLIADDSSVVGVLFLEFLTSCGARCELTPNGTVALELLHTGNFDAAVLDISLPGLSGYEIARRVKGAGSLRQPIRLIGVSAHAGDNERTLALESGMDDFFVKPVELRMLALALGLKPDAAVCNRLPEILLTQLIRTFRAELPRHIESLERALANRDWTEVARHVHQIANGAFALQVAQLNRSCHELEQAARAGNSVQVFALWNQVRSQLSPWLADDKSSPIFLSHKTTKNIPP